MNLRSTENPIERFIDRDEFVVLDGGLATELERLGHDLNHPLWSARLMLSDPDAIKKVHRSFLDAGSDVITTASYQLSYPGCAAVGISESETDELLGKTVKIAIESRQEFLKNESREANRESRLSPLIAASIGPYGAYLANGAEYTGEYAISDDELFDFHRPRWEVLDKTDADLFACETIPSFAEARVMLRLLGTAPDRFVFVSFSCKDDEHISDGTPVEKCAALFAGIKQVIAVGINCTAPRHISGLIEKVRIGAPDKPVVVYPNSGEVYNARAKTWTASISEPSIAEMAPEWLQKGARLVGGCCRVGPEGIGLLRGCVMKR